MPVEVASVLDKRLTVNDAAKSARVHSVTIRRWISSGMLRYTKTKTGRIRILPEDLRAVLSLDEESNQ